MMAVRTRTLVAPAAIVAEVEVVQLAPPLVETSSAAVAPVSVPAVAGLGAPGVTFRDDLHTVKLGVN